MGKKSTPAPPDYAAAAEKTGASNQQAQTRADWTNRPNINTPWGSQSWESSAGVDPSTGQAITNWTQNNTLDPAAQKSLDSQQAVDLGKSQLAESAIGRMQQDYSKPFDWGGLPARGQPVQAGNLQPGSSSAGPLTQAGSLQAGQMQGAGQGMMGGLDTGSLGAMPQAGDEGRQRIENAMFERMRPEHAQQTEALETQLMNQGLTRGSEAWNREMQRSGDQQSRERFNALEAGGREQQAQFGMGMQGRQQGWGELQGAGEFQNRAQGQGFGQELQQAGQNFQQQQVAGQQNFGQQAQANQENFARQQAAGNQNFGQQAQAGQQNFQQQSQASQYANQLRQQQIAEQQLQRSMGLNEMNAILTGAQVGTPQMPSFSQSQSAGGTNYTGAARDQYGAGMDAYNAKAQQQQAMMSGLGSLAGAGMMSDRRLKSNIVRVGTHPRGIGIYEYDIFGERHRGVMAQELQEVAPGLVMTSATGYLMVNYEGL